MTLVFTTGRTLGFHEMNRLAGLIAGSWVFPSTAGGAVTSNSNMAPSVAAITARQVIVNDILDTTGYVGGTVTVTGADATNPRRDIIWYDGAGAVGVTAGTAAANPTLPTLTAGRIQIAEVYVAAGDTSIDAGDLIDRRAARQGVVHHIKTTAQTISASTTFVDANAATGTFSFPIAANEVWLARYVLPMAYTGTGGVKFQFTGPASPTAVRIDALAYETMSTDFTTPGTRNMFRPFAVTSASFSNSFVALSAAATSEGNNSGTSGAIDPATTAPVYIDLLVVNGSTAGTVTLQYAQNSANGTTVGSIGWQMTAVRFQAQ